MNVNSKVTAKIDISKQNTLLILYIKNTVFLKLNGYFKF